MSKCFLCGSKENIEEHHLIPGFLVHMDIFKEYEGCGGTIPLCHRCHRKITWLEMPIEIVLKERIEDEKDE